MKFWLFFCFALTGSLGYGQPYEKLVDSTKLWSSLRQFPPPDYNLYFSYTWFSGDSVINNIRYKKVFVATDSVMLQYNVVALIREDTTGKVFYKSMGNNSEKLIYDFDVKLGDTVFVWNHTVPMFVDLVDDVFIGNKMRKRIHLGLCLSEGETWIEGIGSDYGIISGNLVGWFDIYSRLQCYLKNDSLLYHNDNPTLFSNIIIPGCYYTYDGIDDINASVAKISIVPNPLSSTSTVKILNNSSDNLVEIYSPMGNLVKAMTIPINGEAKLKKSDFPAGIYIIRATGRNNQLYRKLIVRN